MASASSSVFGALSDLRMDATCTCLFICCTVLTRRRKEIISIICRLAEQPVEGILHHVLLGTTSSLGGDVSVSTHHLLSLA